MHLRLTLAQKALILVIVPVLFETVFVAVLAFLLNQAEMEALRESHSKAVIARANDLIKLFYDAGIALAAYDFSHDDAVLRKYESIVDEIPLRLRTLETLVDDDDRQRESFQGVATVCYRGVSLLDDGLYNVQHAGKLFSFDNLTNASKQATNQLVSALHAFISEERKAEALAPAARGRQLVVSWLIGGIVLNLLMALGLALFFNSSTTSRLKVLVDNTRRLAQHKEINPPLTGNDEIAHLDVVFHEMAAQLAEAARMKQELMEMVSHDLRSPLMSIQASLQLLSAGVLGELPERAQNEAAQADNNADRLIRLVNDLLDVEKLSAGKLEMHFDKTSMKEVVLTAINALNAQAKASKVALMLSGDGAEIQGDRDRLVQVVINLFSNAIKFSPAGGNVIAAIDDNAEEWLKVKVIDQGPGIPQDVQKQLFERFQMGAHEGSRKYKGSGLGLYICKVIVEAHGGTVGVTSEEGKGSTFWFRLPRGSGANGEAAT
jgi:signal transduction histidine kinase